MTQITLFPDGPEPRGREHSVAEVSQWLRKRGMPPTWLPRVRYSQQYCAWLNRSERRRQRDIYEALRLQHFKCWGCGTVLIPKYADMHHPLGYTNLGNEDPSELVAVHRRRCHRAAHDAMRAEQERETHWRKAA